MLKKVLFCLTVAVAALTIFEQVHADVYVNGYVRSNGTYVQPHFRSNPDGNFYNNWSTYPNTNPYTGRVGTHSTPSYRSTPSYYSTPSYRSYYSGSYTPYRY